MSLRDFLSKIFHVIILGIFIENGTVTFKVKLYKNDELRCPKCGNKCKKHCGHPHTSRWLCEEFFGLRCYIEYAPNRIKCPEHGAINEAVPWANYHTRFSDYIVNKLVVLSLYADKTFAGMMCGIKNWNTVNNIVNKVLKVTKEIKPDDIFRYLGIDETAYKKGHKYITTVYDHDTKNVIYSGEGKKKEALDKFFKSLTKTQRNAIEVVTADGAPWIKETVMQWCPNAIIIMDPFHVMKWMTEALNNIRNKIIHEKEKYKKKLQNELRNANKNIYLDIKNRLAVCEYEIEILKESHSALLKNADNLDEKEMIKLNAVLELNCNELIEAWEIKEMLHRFFNISDYDKAKALFDDVIQRTRRSSNAEMKKLFEKLNKRYDDIIAYKIFHMSNGPVESFNTKIKLLLRRQFGCKNLDNLDALVCSIGRIKNFVLAYQLYAVYD